MEASDTDVCPGNDAGNVCGNGGSSVSGYKQGCAETRDRGIEVDSLAQKNRLKWPVSLGLKGW